ncbi:MAG TPA: single-stranded-DNA-specific exonuclease RecJ [Micropepsaceae bacterium]|nr:single-stranded-DNA-specific exonuclease RecJ [Micropepsaceae bacterium]
MADAQALAGLISPAAGRAAAPAQYALGVEASFTGRSWRMRELDQDLARELQLAGCAGPLAQLLATRGVTAEQAGNYLDPKLKHLLPDPDSFAHMTAAAARFARAVAQNETISVLADYDVDGACSAALILGWLKRAGRTALLHVPDRLTEGYGPSSTAVRHLREQGASLLVTLDCGAAAYAPLADAAACGLDVIVLDHHAVETNPPVLAHVNPNGPDDSSGQRHVCAAGLTFLFLVAVQRLLRAEGWFAQNQTAQPDLMEELDLVGLATVADVVPLVGLNRAFVRQGLRSADRLRRAGFVALARLANANPPFSVYHLGFVFGPRINAGGRVGRCDLGARLLACTDPQEAEILAAELDRHNRERQSIEAGILRTATELASQQRENPFLLIGGDGWHPGVVGIIAGRLKDRHAKPTLVAGFADNDDDPVGRGSARSVANVDLGAVIRAAHAEGILDAGGGHAMAAGFSIRRSRMGEFADFLGRRIGPASGADLPRERIIDALLSPSSATTGFADEVDRAGPYGAGNPEPLFVMPDMLVVYAGVVGESHVRLRAAGRDGKGISGIAFRAASSELGAALLNARGHRVHLLGRLKRDDYDGVPKVQLQIEDAAAAEA